MRGCPTLVLAVCLPAILCCLPTRADERLKGIACRSVHLGYEGQETVAFYNEVTPRQSAPGTFFMSCGWNTGYFGLQELANGKKLVIFSVWDNARGDDPTAVDEDVQVKMPHQDPAVRVGRFGGEGTGGQSFFDYDWKIDATYRLLVTAQPNARRTEYSGYFFHPEEKEWKKLITFSTVTGGQTMSGFYSFIEDFKRDRKSTTMQRRSEFGNGWLLGANHVWQPIAAARFTADANPVENIDAGPANDRFFLATGGDINMATTQLRAQIQLVEPPATPPADVAELLQ
jgi:hypothetical protein